MHTISSDAILEDRVYTAIPKDATEDVAVCILGAGSGGGPVALNLAMSGIRHLTIVDGDTLTAGNIARHPLGLRYLGWNKARALADEIRTNRSPDADVVAIERFTTDDAGLIDELVSTHDIVVAATDDVATQFMANDAALRAGTLLSFGTCRTGLTGGQAMLVMPESAFACLRCVALHDAIEYRATPPERNYGVTRPMPGLNAFIQRIAFDLWWLTLDAVIRGKAGVALPKPPGPVIDTTFIPIAAPDGTVITRAHANQVRFLPIHPDCPICAELGRGRTGGAACSRT